MQRTRERRARDICLCAAAAMERPSHPAASDWNIETHESYIRLPRTCPAPVCSLSSLSLSLLLSHPQGAFVSSAISLSLSFPLLSSPADILAAKRHSGHVTIDLSSHFHPSLHFLSACVVFAGAAPGSMGAMWPARMRDKG
mmetsp:Transcript_4188/g.14773  ORF Transcript_4188/g.14773 Transcript_4188/m.14773 type:complete len:141 (-) Transcript_4188:712-1134(-)